MMQSGTQTSISRRVLWTFLSVAVVLCAQLAWWVTFNVRSSHHQTLQALKRLERDVRLAEAVIGRVVQATGPQKTVPTAIVQQFFPELSWLPVTERPSQATQSDLARPYPGGQVVVRPDVLAQIQLGHHTHKRMFLSEGAFFLAMVLLGITLIFRTLRREVGVVRQQANFLAAVSHELKSPLASIRLYTETMQLRQVTHETRLRYLNIMRADVDRLETLVGNLLAVARLDHGDYEARPVEVDVVQEIRHIVADLAEDMQVRGAPIVLDLPEGPLRAVVDPAVLTTVLRNILDNAAKYKQHNAAVQVQAHAVRDTIVICVRDQGIGLSSFELPRIFKKFYRVGDEMVRQTEGSGLGLYLVDALWRQNAGRVRALSPGVGLGTTIELTLPLAPEPRAKST